MKLQDIEVGTEVVLTQVGSHVAFDCHKVEKVTKAQVTINSKRFMKSTGNEIGTGSSYDWYIAREWGYPGHLITWGKATELNNELATRVKTRKLVARIKEAAIKLHRNSSFDIETLECIALELESL